MRIGIDFDNTIICYDQVFCDLAKSWELIEKDYQGSKHELRDTIRMLPEGDLVWQRMQGKAYGERIQKAEIFPGFKEFVAACNADTNIEIFIVSHKTEFGHFDENRVNLRDAARQWLTDQGFFKQNFPYINKANVFFELTREEKIERIKSLQCTHFIDDLVEVLASPLFPDNVKRFLFQPLDEVEQQASLTKYSNWADIKNAIFS
ncbi:MAG: hypothetical protein P4M12_05240 [Gammaproteobacteria bacterium]|nr:hypothetical protein [Gammaproteobacteria bacterium]